MPRCMRNKEEYLHLEDRPHRPAVSSGHVDQQAGVASLKKKTVWVQIPPWLLNNEESFAMYFSMAVST